MELPDFHIPHAEKIDWMVGARGWAIEPVAPSTDPPSPAYAYTIGFPERFGFPEVVVVGLTPSAANGLVELVADALAGGAEVPTGVDLVGLLDNDLRCRFVEIAAEDVPNLLPTAVAWRRGAPCAAVQMLWPDRNGFLPGEAGFDRRLTMAQPVLGTDA